MKFSTKIALIGSIFVVFLFVVLNSNFWITENVKSCGHSNHLHFSVDDVEIINKNLSGMKLKSIFDDSTLYFFRQLHLKYNAKISLYCYPPITINRVYANEIKQNADWLHFGFHGNGKSRIKKGILTFYNDIKDSIGSLSCIDDATRLDYYRGGFFSVSILASKRLRYILTRDTKKYDYNYYLPKPVQNILDTAAAVYDKRNNITFIKTDIRIENIIEEYGSVYNLLQSVDSWSYKEKKYLVVFTHERYLRQYKKEIDSIFNYAYKNNYEMGLCEE